MPEVSIIVPCYNEEATIHMLLEALQRQTYPLEKMEVIIADGMSTDGTRAVIAAYQTTHPEIKIRVVQNTRRTIPSGLNQAIEAALGEYLVRLDAHSMPYPDYVERCVRAIQNGQGANVGGVWEIKPGGTGWMARAIAAAAANPLAVGDAQYRFTTQAQNVDTVPFGAFHRSLVEQVGRYDETLLTNEDYEFNARVRLGGGKIWLDPAIRSTYFARRSFGALARQYWRYGFWKAVMLRRYPQTLRWRQAVPPLFVLSLVVLGLLSLWFETARLAFLGELGLYLAVLVASGFSTALKKRDLGLILGMPLAVIIMHFSWAAGLLWSLLISLLPARAHQA